MISIGNTFHNNGNYDKAIEMFNKVLEVDPDNRAALKGVERAERAKAVEKRIWVLEK